MSILSRAIPGLFGGASQQIPAMRHPTQGEEQENALSTAVDGLYKRPGSSFVTQLGNEWASGSSESLIGNVHCHVVDRGVGKRWIITFRSDSVTVHNMDTGASEVVNSIDLLGAPAAFPAYLTASNPQTAFRCLTVADTTLVVNTTKTVTSQNGDASAAPTGEVYVYVRSAVPLHTYTINLNGSTASHTSANPTTVKAITDALITQLNLIAGTVASQVTGVNGLIKIVKAAAEVSVTDTFGNTTMTAITATDGVQKFSDLPPSFVADYRIKITGASTNEDPYFVEWKDKQWKECRAYGVATGFVDSTMPYRLYRGTSEWFIQPVPWVKRLVGDETTNPFPSFTGRAIRNLFFLRNRLGFLTTDSVVLGRPGDFFNLFATTATAVLDSDPIDLGGNAEAIESLDYAIPMGNQLIVWAAKNQQFSLVSGDVLSPETARLVPVTAFATSTSASPKQLGSRILYPATVNGYTQLNMYRVANDSVTNKSEEVTGHVPAYIPPDPRSLEVSEAARIAVVVPQNKANALYVFKYEDDGEKLTQKAWQKFTFAGGIVKAHWSGQLLYLVVENRASTSALGHTLSLEVIDFDTTAKDLVQSFSLKLDRKKVSVGATATGVDGEVFVTYPGPNVEGMKVYRWASGMPVELPIISKVVNAGATASVTYRVRSPATTGFYAVGMPYTFKYTFTEVFMRDGEGLPIMDAKLFLMKMLTRYVDTGYFKATVKTRAQGEYTYTYDGQGVGLVNQFLSTTPTLTTGIFNIPVHADAAGTVITITSPSVTPCRFPYAEWRGNLTMKSQR
jgi:hypothetical protein